MKLALVTGASSGIGLAFARAYAKRGFDIALVGRHAARLTKVSCDLSAEYSVSSIIIEADLSKAEAHLRILDEVRRHDREVAVLVNNAGYGIAQPFANTSWAMQRDFMFVSVVNLCGLTYGVLPPMIAKGQGRIINVASIVALSPVLPGYTLYPAAKSFVLKFSQALRMEVRHAGISITAVCPGYTPTRFHETNGTEHLNQVNPRFFTTSADSVAEAAIAGNNRGRAVVIPGWHNKLAAQAFKFLPDWMIAPVVRRLSTRYRLGSV